MVNELLIIFLAKYLYLFIILGGVIFITKERDQNKQREILLVVVSTLVLATVMALVLGHFYQNPRPVMASRYASFVPKAMGSSFPSTYALVGFSMASVVFLFSRKKGLFLGVMALLVGIGGVILGTHRVLDIFGGLAISIVAVSLVYIIRVKEIDKMGDI